MRGPVASAMAISSWRCSPWLRLATTRIGAVGEADARERRARRLAQLALAARVAPEAEGVAGVRLHGERHVVERREVEEQRGDLERAREPEAGCAARPAAPVMSLAGEADAAGVGRDLAGQLADQRGLAGAVRADDGVQLAARHRERDVVGGDDAAEALGQAVDLRAAAQARRSPASMPSMPPRANSTISSSMGPRIDLPVFAARRHVLAPMKGRRQADQAGQRLLQHQQRHGADHRAEHACPCRPAPP